jgi:hypothetical protein
MRCCPPLLACLCLGCDLPPEEDQTQTPSAEAPAVGPMKSLLVDGFEKNSSTPWACDSADDEAELDYKDEKASQGRHALRVRVKRNKDNTKALKILLRREASFSFREARSVLLDAYSTIPGATVALAFQGAPGDFFQESRAVAPTEPGRDLRFDLTGPNWKNASTRWAFVGPPINLDRLKRLFLIIFVPPNASGDIFLDNLRLETSADSFYREWRPEILWTSPWTDTETFNTLEITALFRASYNDVFDPRDIAVGARITAPDGRTLHLRGFFCGLTKARLPEDPAAETPFWGPHVKPSSLPAKDFVATSTPEEPELPPPPPSTFLHESPARTTDQKKRDEKTSDVSQPTLAFEKTAELALKAAGEKVPAKALPLPVWLIRFTPSEPGRHTARLYVRNRLGEAWTTEESFLVTPPRSEAAAPTTRGGVRISLRDPRHFELEDGAPFSPFGQNVCWTKDWRPYLQKIRAYGGNTCRIWFCPWGLMLENPKTPGTYDLAAAERMDELVETAERQGLRLIVCFAFHGMTGPHWKKYPYAMENGGPCARPEDFFTNEKARAQFASLLRYATSRWGHSPAIFAWELFNELDLAACDRKTDLVDWVLDMAGRLKYADAHRRPVTFSVNHADFFPQIWRDARLDFISVHLYGPKTADLIDDALAHLRSIPKPCMIAEFGGHWEPAVDTADVKGLRLKDILWLTACRPTPGPALPWWWDVQIEVNRLYPRFQAVGAFLKGDDRRGRFQHWLRTPLADGWEASGIMDAHGGRFFVRRRDHEADPTTAPACPVSALSLTGVVEGAFSLEIWDAETGRKEKTTTTLRSERGLLKISLPARRDSFALKLDALDPPIPRLTTD